MSAQPPNCLAVIAARGGSKGLANKNLLRVGGKTLVRLAVEAALASRVCTRVVCSTDSDAIAAEAAGAGAEVPFRRPAELATDSATSLDVLLHATTEMERLTGMRLDLVCLVEPTTPLRAPRDIRSAMELLLAAEPAADSVVSLCEVTDAHPAWLRKIVGGHVVPYFDSLPQPTRRQDLARQPVPYRRNGAVYITRRDVLIGQRSIYGQRCLGYVMPPARSVNIDTELDLLIAQALAERPPDPGDDTGR